ncbi:hypothetical protein [Sphingomonas colocasiae]|uniref:Tetratricopeptide repeat protein n=1 Tax=Sphingomonas colocasiae TaxID=1848973 RepID=A0ABS7PQL4_9SPHN|nr:hypothetical protein [Sphingomonas colocasiae]MBY8823613.1 hypothetical protein [Sphingomonas colocasiae]
MTSVGRLILMGVLALGCAWLVVRTAMVNSVDQGVAVLVERFAPGSPQVDLAIASSEFVADGGGQPVATPEIVRRGHDALRKSPLAAEPFLFDGAAAMAAGRAPVADRLFAEALRRDPRSQLTRLLLYQNLIGMGRYERGFRELMDLARLAPALVGPLAPQLAKLAVMPEMQASLHRTLRLNPAMHDALLLELVKARTDPSVILALADPIRRTGPKGRPPSWQGAFLNSLIVRGQVAEAHRLWRRFTGIPAVDGIFDPDFERRVAPPPFNWILADGGAGVAELTKGEGLAIEYFGRQPAELARQLIVLEPGRYRFSARFSTEEADADTGLEWRISCARSRIVLGALPVPGTGGREVTAPIVFDVPDDCAAQILALRGTPRDSGGASHAKIRGLGLKREGAQ